MVAKENFNPFSAESLDFQSIDAVLKCILGIVGIAAAFLAGAETMGVLRSLPPGETSRRILDNIQA